MIARRDMGTWNDDGWIPITAFCLTTSALAVLAARRCARTGFPGFLAGLLYEQVVEWAAHGWLQSQPVEGLEFFRWRHSRHHEDPVSHHALQPISIWVPTVGVLLSPAFVAARSASSSSRSAGLGVISGFLFAHAVLNIEHYDIHAERKVVPRSLRRTYYYREVERIHLAHHAGSDARIYGVTNPWLDMVLHRLRATDLLDVAYRRIGRTARHLDVVWPRLDARWHAVYRSTREREAAR